MYKALIAVSLTASIMSSMDLPYHKGFLGSNAANRKLVPCSDIQPYAPGFLGSDAANMKARKACVQGQCGNNDSCSLPCDNNDGYPLPCGSQNDSDSIDDCCKVARTVTTTIEAPAVTVVGFPEEFAAGMKMIVDGTAYYGVLDMEHVKVKQC